ncbi:hypothetical protein CW304_24820 [Bacillus sp. UFRGS-B20]|nr:hypothetical protein CW304_24820 [Bacillus sp. UFRGS-B20]
MVLLQESEYFSSMNFLTSRPNSHCAFLRTKKRFGLERKFILLNLQDVYSSDKLVLIRLDTCCSNKPLKQNSLYVDKRAPRFFFNSVLQVEKFLFVHVSALAKDGQ